MRRRVAVVMLPRPPRSGTAPSAARWRRRSTGRRRPSFRCARCRRTLYLLERGVRITGTDAWSWDAPFDFTQGRVAATGDYSLVWEGHKAGRERAYCHLEKLHNLEALPATGFKIACFPVKIRGASAGWTRAVAILSEAEGPLPGTPLR
jgi:kynurenine formamidase